MRIGMVGLGKLGLPCALAMESKGHEVRGWDAGSIPVKILESRSLPYEEKGAQELLANTSISLMPPGELSKWADIVFVAVQTPHLHEYEGVTELPDSREDFYYGFLEEAVKSVGNARLVVVISTVLPGTMGRRIRRHALNQFAYNPYFIAMGTCIPDFLYPEFVIVGSEDHDALQVLREFYATIHSKPVFATTVKNAELIKVVYNTYISTKIGFINMVMEVCEKIGANVDDVSDALALATDRIISTKYLRGGMGDGGGCHPRDNIAMSWLARTLGLSYDWCGEIMKARQEQTRWLAGLVETEARMRNLPVCITGISFKAGTNIMVGSPAILMKSMTRLATKIFDPHCGYTGFPTEPHVFVIGTNHPEFAALKFPRRSVVIDPWGYIGDQEGVVVRRIGRCE